MSDHDNIVLITVDSLRADYCGFAGGCDSHTPAMDRLAEDGLVFENAIAPGPATTDSMPVIFSGQFYPRPNSNWSAIDQPAVLRDHMLARETIPERLSRRGYETGAFTTNPWTSRQYGFDEGFDFFEDFMAVNTDSEAYTGRLIDRLAKNENGGAAIKPLQLLLDWQRQNDMFQSWGTFYDDVVAWTKQAEEPYFLWIFLVDAHMPFLPPDGFHSQSRFATIAANLWLYLDTQRFESTIGNRLQTAYADTIRYVDDRLDQLTTELSDDDPIVVVHGDHGEEFGERGVYGHGKHLSEELIRVPLLVANGPTDRIKRPFSLAKTPELLERLADGDAIADLTSPVVQSRNFDPKTAARGIDWKYVQSENEERVYRLSNGSIEEEVDNVDLQGLGRDFVSQWKREDTERRDIVRSVQTICETATI